MSSYVSFNESNVFDDSKMLSIGNVFIDGIYAPLEIPLSCANSKSSVSFTLFEPEVGALKFVAMQSVKSNASI